MFFRNTNVLGVLLLFEYFMMCYISSLWLFLLYYLNSVRSVLIYEALFISQIISLGKKFKNWHYQVRV